jgi:hypothetical protein
VTKILFHNIVKKTKDFRNTGLEDAGVETRSPNGEMFAGTSTVACFECASIDALTWYYLDMRDRVVQERRNQMAAQQESSSPVKQGQRDMSEEVENASRPTCTAKNN